MPRANAEGILIGKLKRKTKKLTQKRNVIKLN